MTQEGTEETDIREIDGVVRAAFVKAASKCTNESGNFDEDRPMGATKSSRLRRPWSVSQSHRGPTYRAFHPKFKRHLQETKNENVDIATSQVNSKLVRLSPMLLKWFCS